MKKVKSSNKIKDLLIALNICHKGSIETFYPQVRDRSDVAVLRCRQSGVIFLSRSDHIDEAAYQSRSDLNYWGKDDRSKNLSLTRMDDERRAQQFHREVAGKIWLDVGTGLGGILDLLSPVATESLAVEPQQGARQCLEKLGYTVYSSIQEIDRKDIEIVTLFHVLEHLDQPLQTLAAIKKLMKKKGKIIIEVPHAKDALIARLDCEAFKKFTFWSEHLILHTRSSLKKFLQAAGFKKIDIYGFQRYPLANHLYWLAKGLPGGHVKFKELDNHDLNASYMAVLDKLDLTDTLIAVAEV